VHTLVRQGRQGGQHLACLGDERVDLENCGGSEYLEFIEMRGLCIRQAAALLSARTRTLASTTCPTWHSSGRHIAHADGAACHIVVWTALWLTRGECSHDDWDGVSHSPTAARGGAERTHRFPPGTMPSR
jgi:hypothetical protein